jgi:serine/threonine protein kinase
MLREGTILQQNRYRITHLLGRGGMGAVYAAWHLSLEIPVAIKELTPQADLDPQTLGQLRAQFKREAMTLARLNISGFNLGFAGWGILLVLLGALTLIRPFLSKSKGGTDRQ